MTTTTRHGMAVWLRSTPHEVAEVRAALADVLEQEPGGPERLHRAVTAAYGDAVQVAAMDALERVWGRRAQMPDGELDAELHDLLVTARGEVWDAALDALTDDDPTTEPEAE